MTKYLIPKDTTPSTPLSILSSHWHKFIGYHVIDNVRTGLTFTSGGGLNASCAVGNGMIQGCYFETDASITIALTDNATNYLYAQLTRNGANEPTDWSVVKNTTGTPPTDSMLLATILTSGGTISTITDKRTLKPDNQTLLARIVRHLSDNLVNYIELKAPTGMSSNKTWLLPVTDIVGGVIKSDGSGTLSIADTPRPTFSRQTGGSATRPINNNAYSGAVSQVTKTVAKTGNVILVMAQGNVSNSVNSSNADFLANVSLFVDGAAVTSITNIGVGLVGGTTPVANSRGLPFTLFYIHAPTSGNHTYDVRVANTVSLGDDAVSIDNVEVNVVEIQGTVN